MTEKLWKTLDWRGDFTALLAGILLPLSLAPYNIWALGIVSSSTLAVLLNGLNSKQCLLRSFLFGLGVFGSGISWVYVSIHDFGFTGAPLAVFMTAIFVAFLALVFSLPFYIYGRFINASSLGFTFGFPAIWVLGEWLRSWLFTGFPWLYSGYAHIDTWLAPWAPIGGVFLLSFLSVATGTFICHIIKTLYTFQRATDNSNAFTKISLNIIVLIVLLGSWAGGLSLHDKNWTQATHDVQSVAIMQPNVPLEFKWNPYNYPKIMSELEENAARYQEKDIQVWPEAAIPSVYHSVQYFIEDIDAHAQEGRTNIFSGVLYDKEEPLEVYNGIIGLGLANGVYFKQKLVPFGEYVPFENQLRGLIAFFDLPNSVIRIGPFKKDALSAVTNNGAPYTASPFICYEIVYPDFVARNARNAELMLTISNDAWFGDSIGPLQHFEMARMRALENQKPLIRSTNTGISAIIDNKGNVIAQSAQFQKEVLTGNVQLHSGITPFARYTSIPILAFCFIVLFTVLLGSQKHKRLKIEQQKIES